ncbi:MAG: peptide chain release factor 1 [Patescibacteria group bacterium]|jgi:peptide chain release factor 1
MFEEILKKFKNLEKELSDPKIASNPERLKTVSKEHSDLKEAAGLIMELNSAIEQIAQSREIINSESGELADMAKDELAGLEEKKGKLEAQIKSEISPAHPFDKKNIIMEIRAGTGGDESALFAAELYRLYSRFAERSGWKINILDSSPIGIGGFKDITFSIEGKNVYSNLKFEAGTHRVQRVPETEKAGRIHTSAVTVAVLAEADEVDVQIKAEDLRIDTYAASGPGGQKVNTTNSAVRITHLPTGVVVQCQDQKSQRQNKDKAMLVLRSRILQKMEEDRHAREAAERRDQVGSGDRSEKIRTYNFPQDRVTDHRIKKSWHSIDRIMDGDLLPVIEELKKELGN